VRLPRTHCIVCMKDFQLVRHLLIPSVQLKCDQGDRMIISQYLRHILNHDLHLFPYKVQLTQKLLPVDRPRRWEWAQRAIEMAETEENVWQKIIMSDEAHFTLTGTVNKQNSMVLKIFKSLTRYLFMTRK